LKLENVKISGASTPDVSGYLEVEVNGKLIHSKKNGDGYVNTADKMNKILNAVKEASKGDTTKSTSSISSSTSSSSSSSHSSSSTSTSSSSTSTKS